MKYIKTYESISSYPFQDNYLKINKVKTGPNMGRIKFYFWSSDHYKESDWYKLSMVSGCATILDTKYEKNPQIREITLGPQKFRKVQTNTVQKVIFEFLVDMGYDKKEGFMWHGSGIIKDLTSVFRTEIRKSTSGNNLGDVIDSLRIVRDKVFEEQKEHYERYELEKRMSKYNL